MHFLRISPVIAVVGADDLGLDPQSYRAPIRPVGNLFHQKLPEAKEDKLHPVRCGENSLLYRLYGPLAMVNSFHHQAVDRLGQGLKATAWSEGGIVEAMEHETLPIISVQFHPERMSYEKRRADAVDGRFLFEEFIALCKEYRTKERSAPGR